MATCSSCGNANAYRQRFSSGRWSCDGCGVSGSAYLPDVYFKGSYQDEGLTFQDRPETWMNGTKVTSRGQKAILMKQLGVREAGDRVHGARNYDPRTRRIISI